MLESSLLFWVKMCCPEIRNTPSSWHLSVKDFGGCEVREEGDRVRGGACHWRLTQPMWLRSKWLSDQRSASFSRTNPLLRTNEMSSTWKGKAWVRALILRFMSPGCLLPLFLGFASGKQGCWERLFCLPYRTLGRAHGGPSWWKWFFTLSVIRTNKWYWTVWIRETPSTATSCEETLPLFHSCFLDQRPLNSSKCSLSPGQERNCCPGL